MSFRAAKRPRLEPDEAEDATPPWEKIPATAEEMIEKSKTDQIKADKRTVDDGSNLDLAVNAMAIALVTVPKDDKAAAKRLLKAVDRLDPLFVDRILQARSQLRNAKQHIWPYTEKPLDSAMCTAPDGPPTNEAEQFHDTISTYLEKNTQAGLAPLQGASTSQAEHVFPIVPTP